MTPEEHRREHRRLQELTRRNLMGLIDSELSLAVTMSDLAETETALGDEPHARVLLAKVKEAMDSVQQHVTDDRVSDDEHREIEGRLRELRSRLEALHQQVSE